MRLCHRRTSLCGTAAIGSASLTDLHTRQSPAPALPCEEPLMSLTAIQTVALLVIVQATPAATHAPAYPSPSEVKDAFLTLLDRPKVPLDITIDAIQRGDDGLVTERLSFASERKADGTVERVPMLLVRPEIAGKRP